MAITGEGTQDNPYLVHTIAEFREKAAEADCYIKLANDLDCNKEKYLSWETLDVYCADIDLNEFSIRNPYLEGGNSFIRTGRDCIIHNGAIMGMYLSSNTTQSAFRTFHTAYIEKCTLDHVAMEITILDGSISTVFYSYGANEINRTIELNFCNIKLLNNSEKAKLTFDEHRGYTSYRIINNSLITVINTKASQVGEGSTYNGYAEGQIDDSRLEIIYKNAIPTNNIFSSRGMLRNCVINLDVNAVEKPSTVPGLCLGIPSGIYNKDKAKFANGEEGFNFGSATGCADTDEEIKNPDYNNSIGFTVVEVD